MFAGRLAPHGAVAQPTDNQKGMHDQAGALRRRLSHAREQMTLSYDPEEPAEELNVFSTRRGPSLTGSRPCSAFCATGMGGFTNPLTTVKLASRMAARLPS